MNSVASNTGKAEHFQPPAIEPDPRAGGLIGFIRAMVGNPVSAIPPEAYREGVTLSYKTGKPVAFVCDPDVLDQILVRRPQDFPKSIVDERVLRPAFGDSLLTAHNESWRWKRRLAAPYFSPSALAKMVPSMVEPFAGVANHFQKRNDTEPVDISDAMTRATLEVIACTLFTNGEELDMEAVSEAIADYLAPISWTISLASFRLPAWTPHPGKSRLRRGRDKMRGIVGDVIARRRQGAREYKDICSDLMEAQDPETGGRLSDDDLVDMLLTLVAAGHETSANALTWTLYCLAMQPGHQGRIREEILSVATGGPVLSAHLPQLNKTEAFIKESMRLFPPVPMMARQTSKAEILAGHKIPPNTTLFIPIYAIHRHEKLWNEPALFNPARFEAGRAKVISRTAYMPFGAGQRICIGATFAMMEMVAGLATILRDTEFSFVSSTICDPVSQVTLRPRDGLMLGSGSVSPRDARQSSSGANVKSPSHDLP